MNMWFEVRREVWVGGIMYYMNLVMREEEIINGKNVGSEES